MYKPFFHHTHTEIVLNKSCFNYVVVVVVVVAAAAAAAIVVMTYVTYQTFVQ
jgi:hypothetical protein